jgi:hypothetical protein
LVNRGVVYHGFGELFAEKSQRLPVLAYLLLNDRSDMGVGSVHSQGENGPQEGVGQGYSSNEGRLGSGDRGLHVRLQGEGLGVTQECGSERTERASEGCLVASTASVLMGLMLPKCSRIAAC